MIDGDSLDHVVGLIWVDKYFGWLTTVKSQWWISYELMWGAMLRNGIFIMLFGHGHWNVGFAMRPRRARASQRVGPGDVRDFRQIHVIIAALEHFCARRVRGYDGGG